MYEEFPPTDEQNYAISLLTGTEDNLLFEALAGTGKTSTLLLMLRYTSAPRVLFLTFNTRIRDTMEKKVNEMQEYIEEYNETHEDKLKSLPMVEIRTVNSQGHRAWQEVIPYRISIPMKDKKPIKMQEILSYIIAETKSDKDKHEAYDSWHEIISAISAAKNAGYVPEGQFPNAKRLIDSETFWSSLEEGVPTDLVQYLVDACLVASIFAAYKGSIDFDDQCYMSTVFGGSFPKFPLVLVDETQDLNRTQHEMLCKMRSSRIIAVGDDRQSIYAFRGALPGGMAQMAERLKMAKAGLSISFRCPEAVVRNVHWRVPYMKWFKTGGRVERLTSAGPDTFVDGAAIICRNNAPLFSLAFRLLRAGRNVTVAGSDLSARIIAILRKLGDESMTRAQLLLAIEAWRAEKTAKGAVTANDTADCMRIFAENGENLGQAIAYANDLFSRSGPLTLITGHKAKGLEWEVVYHLDPWLINDGGGEQELNLRYVIQTRALREYYEINTVEIKFNELDE